MHKQKIGLVCIAVVFILVTGLSFGCIEEQDKEPVLVVEIPENTNNTREIPSATPTPTTPTPTETPTTPTPTETPTTPTPTETPTTPIPTETPTPPPEDIRQYYTYNGEKKYAEWEEGDRIALYLIETGEDIGWYYNVNIFDCSEMTACYERAFENAGFNAKIAIGYGPNGGHAWLVVEKEDTGDGRKWLWFEATAQEFLHPQNYIIYEDCMTFDNINEALERSVDEFNWWESLEGFEDVRWILKERKA